jgi:hypothetical protein
VSAVNERCDVAVVTGGRDYTLTEADFAWLDAMLDRFRFRLLVHGDCRGVDRTVADWGRRRNRCVVACPAQWEAFRRKYGRPHGAGPARNHRIAWALGPMRAIALVFPGGSGTADMMNRCIEMGIPRHFSPTARPNPGAD